MILHKDPLFTLFFGTAEHAFIPADFHHRQDSLLMHKPFASIKQYISMQELIFLDQTHSTHGISIDSHSSLISFAQQGDFLTTNIPGIGLGIATADCLPLFIIDRDNAAIAAVHAGWRATVAHIMIKVLDHMHQHYGTRPHNVDIVVGPSAQVCCYEVSPDFIRHLPAKNNALIRRKNKFYCDIAALNQKIGEQWGIPEPAFKIHYKQCTICTAAYCSYRRTKNAERNINIICLT